jgi:hypothetical protein
MSQFYSNVQCWSNFSYITLDTLDILPYTLDILMTNIDHKHHLHRKAYRLSHFKWHGLLLNQYASSCCRFPQRSSSLTQPSRLTGEVFNQLQRSWWSHCVAPVLPRPLVRLVSSCPESSVPGGKGDFYEKDNLHSLCCSGMWTGEHNHFRHQSIDRNETTNDPRHCGRYRRFRRSLDYLGAGIAPYITKRTWSKVVCRQIRGL